LMKRLAHPNIVAFKDSFVDKDSLCIIMTYCDGGDLSARVAACGGALLKEDQILHWFVQLALVRAASPARERERAREHARLQAAARRRSRCPRAARHRSPARAAGGALLARVPRAAPRHQERQHLCVRAALPPPEAAPCPQPRAKPPLRSPARRRLGNSPPASHAP